MTCHYVVTVYNKEDLPLLYSKAHELGAECVCERKISKSTEYNLTEEQAALLKSDPIVRDVQKVLDPSLISRKLFSVNNESWTASGNFSKEDSVFNTSDTDLQWGFLHCAGSDAQRRKGTWGENSSPLILSVNDSVDIFNNGKHVDVIVCDSCLSSDLDEWLSPSTGLSRFVEYQWFNELNGYLGVSSPSGTVSYYTNSTNPEGHGNHVGATMAGQYYGWAREANIYSLPFDGFPSGQFIPDTILFDYIRAFHLTKPINPATGRKNPTVVNCSWGYVYDFYIGAAYPSGWSFSDLTTVVYDGVTYDSGNPGPSGWTEVGVEADFGISPVKNYMLYVNYLNYELEQCRDDGVIVVAGAGNYNNEALRQDNVGFNDYFVLGNFQATVYYRTGASPSTNTGCICAGALSNDSDFKRASFSVFGERVDIWAPGEAILSADIPSLGLPDGKYGGDNWYSVRNGTSMASPQVSGAAALLSSTKHRFTADDFLGYLQRNGKKSDMTFNSEPGGPGPATYTLDVNPDTNGTDWLVSGPDAVTYHYDLDPLVTVYEGDTLVFQHYQRGHYVSMNSAVGTSDYDMSWYDADSNQTNGLDIPISIDEGEVLTMEISFAGGGHPLYIRSILNDPASDLTSVTGQGAEFQGEAVLWQTQIGDAGTYYYQCGNHPSMSGTITVNPAGTTYNNPLYLQTSTGTGGVNLIPGVTNQGTYCPGTGPISLSITSSNFGVYYYQHGTDANLYGVINATARPGVIGQVGNYIDPTCQKGSPDQYLLSVNSRLPEGYILDDAAGQRKSSVLKYPRKKVYFG